MTIFVIMLSLTKEYNQIMNLTKFSVNFSKFIINNELLSHDPYYILEKYNHWIGFKPVVEYQTYTPDSMTDFFLKYSNRWSTYDANRKEVKNILMYLNSTLRLDLVEMSNKFEEYIGPVSMISDVETKGLHHRTNEFVDKVLEKTQIT